MTGLELLPNLSVPTLTQTRLSSPTLPEGTCFSNEDLKAEIITFTAATLDGVAAFISPFVDNMLQNDHIRDRLTAEIQEADRIGHLSSPVVSYEETTRLPFFMGCIKETLRFDAPAQTILPRIVSEPGVWLQHDIYVPSGTQVGASPYIIHRNETIFGEDANEFKPTRWLEGECNRCDTALQHTAHVRLMEKYGMWWGYGDRECAGKYYAQMEMQKLCVELFRRFDMTSASSQQRFKHERWAVGMFWNQRIVFRNRKSFSSAAKESL